VIKLADNRLKEYGKEVFKKIQYKPTSSSIKPVHIANGLFRLVLGSSYNIKPLHEWSTIKYKQGKEVYPISYIIENYDNLIDGDATNQQISDLRYFLEAIFNADKGNYPSMDYSVLTICSKTQVNKKVQNEYKMPRFLYNILSTKIDGQVSPCIELIKKCLEDESDDLSRLVSPIIKMVKKKIHTVEEADLDLTGVELRIRKAFDRLAYNANYKNTNKLLSMERIILFACFSIILHLSSRIIDLSDKYDNNNRIPILFDSDRTLAPIEYASQETVLRAKLGIEEYFENELEGILKQEGYESFTHKEMLERINMISIADSNKIKNKTPEKEKRKEYKKLYLGFYEQSRDPFDAIIKATRFKLFSDEYSTSPSNFMTSLGRKIKLVYGKNKTSRFSPDPVLLETILLTILEPDNRSMNLSEFGIKLWNEFGVIIGANPEIDFENLAKWNVSQNTPGDLAGSLAQNAKKIADMYIAMGYGKRYADGVTILGLNL